MTVQPHTLEAISRCGHTISNGGGIWQAVKIVLAGALVCHLLLQLFVSLGLVANLLGPPTAAAQSIACFADDLIKQITSLVRRGI